jgi:phage head maturation protease
MAQISPPGLVAGTIQHRYADTTPLPSTYSEANRTVDCVISTGSPVARFYGTEILRIAPDAVIIDRLVAGGIPLLDSHQQGSIINALGRVTQVWFAGGALMGKLKFNETRDGRIAQGMVGRGEISGISAGYRVEQWEISDDDGNVLDPETYQFRWDETGLTFTATRWELLEASLVSVPADIDAAIRSLGDLHHDDSNDARVRMEVRQRIAQRQRMHDAAQIMLGESQ